jgi:DNA repair protein RadC
MADYELLELLLTYVIPRIDTKPLAKALIHQFGTLLAVLQQPYERLGKVDGIGPKSALLLKVVHAFLTRSMESAVEKYESISGPEDIFAFVRLHLGSRSRECVYALYLDNAKQVVHHCEVASGTIDRTAIFPREILKPAFMVDAVGFVLVHNHPDGLPVPSEEDHQLTEKIESLANSIGIRLIDHMIVTRTQAYSLKTGKLL